MADTAAAPANRGTGQSVPPGAPLIPVMAFGTSLGLFLVISYSLCVLLYLVFPNLVLNHEMLTLFLPGFKLLTWGSFILGLVESFGYGWYVALVFGPLYNFFAARSRTS